jgi:hypothetical protein
MHFCVSYLRILIMLNQANVAEENGKIQKWSADSALQILKVLGDSEVVDVSVVRFPWIYPHLSTQYSIWVSRQCSSETFSRYFDFHVDHSRSTFPSDDRFKHYSWCMRWIQNSPRTRMNLLHSSWLEKFVCHGSFPCSVFVEFMLPPYVSFIWTNDGPFFPWWFFRRKWANIDGMITQKRIPEFIETWKKKE